MTSELDKNVLKPIKLYNNNLVSEKQMVVSRHFRDNLWKLSIMQYLNKTWIDINIWTYNHWCAFGRKTIWFTYV